MGPDQAFAAHMWTWPDAAIKRDASGAVLFVNAAFLALYGGRAEDWHGMGVSGWSAPTAPGQSVRFETRIADESGVERVYDWVESVMADGSALAMARDVSDLVTPTGGQPIAWPAGAVVDSPAHVHAEAQDVPVPAFETVSAAPVPDAPVEAPAPSVAPEPAPAVAVEDPAWEAPQPTPAETTPALPEAVVAPADTQAAPEPAPAPAADAAPVIEDFDIDILDVDAPAAPAAPVVETPPVAEAPPAPEPEPQPDREFERRALPVEDSNSVLGNNWRDAVIAKAVGAGDVAEEATDTPSAPAAAPTASAASPRAAGDAVRILLAEDNAINALLTRTLLEAEGCVVDTVEDGALAVEAVKAKPYDLIFMDMRMPNMDGLDATRKIRSMDHASKGLPIVALTANAFDDDRNACFDAGMNDFMTKPVSAEELSEMVAQWAAAPAADKVAATA